MAWWSRPAALWLAFSALLALGALAAWWFPNELLDWQPALASSQAVALVELPPSCTGR